MLISVISIMLTAGVQVWTEPSLIAIDEPGRRSPFATRNARLFAARGEYESFQLCVTSEKNAFPKIQIEGEPLNDIPAPAIYRVGFLHTSESAIRTAQKSSTVPDVLLEPLPEDLPPNSTQIFWIRYHIPANANPGAHKGKLRILSDGRCLKKVKVRFEVFDFTLPNLPSLPVLVSIQPNPFETFYGLRRPNIADWKPFYDSLAGYRISLDITPIQSLIDTKSGAAWNANALKDHLDYLTPTLSMTCIAVRTGEVSPESKDNTSLEPFVLHLRDMTQWLNERGWLKRACLPLIIPENRDLWSGAAQQFIRIGNAEDRIARLIIGPPDPQFERQADRWAFPLYAFAPDWVTRLKTGLSLCNEQTTRPIAVSASSCGNISNLSSTLSAPEDLCDGAITTAWTSKQVPTVNRPEWIQLDFPESITAESILIQWVNGMDSADIDTLAATDGVNFSSYTVRWESRTASYAYALSQTHGEFRYPNTLKSLRLVFKSSISAAPIGIAEISVNPPEETTPATLNAPIQPWLLISGIAYPALRPGVHPVEPRSIPWICWAHQFDGVVCPWLNDWPPPWKKHLDAPPNCWDAEKHPPNFLVYPGRNMLMPSIRLERLRDGLEDYEYLKAFAEAVQAGKIKKRKLLPLTQHHLLDPQPDSSQLDDFTRQILHNRLLLGHALSQKQH
ncbi:MAG TPA: DUF4091 domain-containing protein [Candidatus Hydrogenedentes bacterium]|nr:DUF4091 domain-containing protein [Candidatus Hydrogenedentota bacterium]